MSRTSRCEVIETVFELEAVPELDLVDGLFLAEIEFPPSEARALVVRVGLTAFLVVRALLPSMALEAFAFPLLEDWVALPVGAMFLSPLKISTSARVRMRLPPEISMRTN